MPTTVEIDGKPTTLFTNEELTAQIATARQTAIAELDINAKTAAARRDAEARMSKAEQDAAARIAGSEQAAEARISSLQAGLEAALKDKSTTITELEALKAELDGAKIGQDLAFDRAIDMQIGHERRMVMIENGVRPTKTAEVEALLRAKGTDFSDDIDVLVDIEILKEDTPGLFSKASQNDDRYIPSGTSHNGPPNIGVQSVKDVEAMNPREYAKWHADTYGKKH